MSISRRDRNGERVDAPDYMSTVAMGQSLDALHKSAKPLTGRAGRDVKPVAGKTRGRWYDAETN